VGVSFARLKHGNVALVALVVYNNCFTDLPNNYQQYCLSSKDAACRVFTGIPAMANYSETHAVRLYKYFPRDLFVLIEQLCGNHKAYIKERQSRESFIEKLHPHILKAAKQRHI
jgi:hypothetical protein